MADRLMVSANGNEMGTWGFDINPVDHDMRPEYQQNIIKLLDGSVFIIEPENDSTVLTLSWNRIPEDTYGNFVFGKAEGLKFSKVYLYFTSRVPNPIITDMTYESHTHDTVNIPFIDVGNGLEEAYITHEDRLLVGLSEKFNGVLFDFEDYLSNQVDSDGNLYVERIDFRFSVTGGNLASGDTVEFDGTMNVDDDDTELFQHYGQIRWSLAQVPSWGKCSMNDIINNTAEYSTPSGFSDTDEYYWCEIKLSPDHTTPVITELNPKLQAIKVALDSLDAMAARKSNGILPIWYIHIPTSLKFHRPRGYRDTDWIGVQVTNISQKVSSPTDPRWNVSLKMIPVTKAMEREYFVLGISHLDGNAYLE